MLTWKRLTEKDRGNRLHKMLYVLFQNITEEKKVRSMLTKYTLYVASASFVNNAHKMHMPTGTLVQFIKA